MTTALYRRYRPESFAEVIGQEQVTGPLSIALSKNRVNHAYLFSGPRGCGKTTSARILARCLNCADGPTPTPCGVCPSCVELARGGPGSLDVVEIDAASHGGVDDARDLRERAAFAPVRDRYKVFIIDEAHMVSPQGFNALLKIVEEPPEHIRFIFATTEPEKVIGTIRSRTHHYPFRLVPPERLTSYLAELCEREGVDAGKGVLPLVVRSGGGSVRDSLSVLDQLIGGAGEEGLTYATAVALLGYTDIALLDDVTDALAATDGATVFRVVDRVIESGHDPRRFVEDLLERMRDLLVVAALRDGGHAVFRGLPDDQLERMRGQATRFGAAELSRAADVTNAALTEMTGATSPRLQLELLCARLLLPSAEEGERGLAARLDRLEKRINVAGGVLPAAGPATAPVAPAPVVAAPRPAAAIPVARPAEPSGGPVGAPPEQATAVADPASGPPAVSGSPAAAGPPAGPGSPAASAGAQVSGSGGAGPVAWPEPSRPQVAGGPAAAPSAAAAASPTPPAAPASGGPVPVGPPAIAAAPSGAAVTGDLEAVRRMWTEVLNALASIKRTTWSLVSQYAQVLDYDGKRLMLGFDSAGRAQSFARGAHPEFLRQALIEVIGLDCVVEATASSAFRSGPPAPGAPARAAAPTQQAAPPNPPSPPAARPPAAPDPDPTPPASPARPPAEPSSPPPSSSPQSSWASQPSQSQPSQSQPSQSQPSQSAAPRSAAPHWTTPQAAPSAPSASSASSASSGPTPPAPRPARSAPESRPASGRRPQTSPYDDIPPPLDEPPPEEDLPPDDGHPVPSSWPKATRPPAPQNRNEPARNETAQNETARAETAQNEKARNEKARNEKARAEAPVWPQAARAEAPTRGGTNPPVELPVQAAAAVSPPPPARMAPPAPTAPVPAEPVRVVDLTEDGPSADDPDYEGSADFGSAEMVGAQVIQDLLGGHVIEEHS